MDNTFRTGHILNAAQVGDHMRIEVCQDSIVVGFDVPMTKLHLLIDHLQKQLDDWNAKPSLRAKRSIIPNTDLPAAKRGYDPDAPRPLGSFLNNTNQ